ncbi:MAG: PucR family transcriptional regulator ligand-binding domain-containing protein [Alkalibacterium gilvum]
MLTVKRFLELSPFYELKILSGHNGLDNIITSGNIMDNPDAIDWFSVGELLLTSGYFFKDSPELQNNIMKQLKDLNCPALCIKP